MWVSAARDEGRDVRGPSPPGDGDGRTRVPRPHHRNHLPIKDGALISHSVTGGPRPLRGPQEADPLQSGSGAPRPQCPAALGREGDARAVAAGAGTRACSVSPPHGTAPHRAASAELLNQFFWTEGTSCPRLP